MRRKVTSWIWLALLVPLWLAGHIDRAAAGVLYSYKGLIDRLEYNDVSPGSFSPFYIGQNVTAYLYVPRLINGRFYIGSFLYVDNGDGSVSSPDWAPLGVINFEGTDILGLGVGGPTDVAAGYFPARSDILIEYVDFCCAFSSTPHGMEDGQASFIGGDFRAIYLPTGQTHINVTAYGTGRWTARFIPEPASVALFGIALIGLAALARRSKVSS